jgi:hypothetical protein
VVETAHPKPSSGPRTEPPGGAPRSPGPSSSPRLPTDPRAARILARTLFRDMQSHGVPSEQILEVASELIGLVTSDLATPER